MKKKIAVLMVAAAIATSMMVSCSATDSTDTSSGNSTISVADKVAVNVDDIDIADDWKSGQIAIDGVVYTLPCEFSEFENNNWQYHGDEGDLKANQYSISQRIKKDDSTILAQMINMSGKKIPMVDGQVGQIQIKVNDGVSVVLPGGLVFDENTTVDDVKAKYGEPEKENKVDNYVTLNYKGDTNEEIKFFIYNQGSKMEKYSSVTIRNFGV